MRGVPAAALTPRIRGEGKGQTPASRPNGSPPAPARTTQAAQRKRHDGPGAREYPAEEVRTPRKIPGQKPPDKFGNPLLTHYFCNDKANDMSEQKLKIGIAQGDPNGIGWEVILKALADTRMTELCTPVIYGSPRAAEHYRKLLAGMEEAALNPVVSGHEARSGKVNLVACGEVEQVTPGQATPEAGRAAVEALRRATQELKEGRIDALVTAPFDKETVQSDDFRHTGHTEFLGAELEGEPLMVLCSDILRVGLVTKHIPVSEISRSITREKIVRDLQTMRRTLIEDFGIVEPRIAVMALNPHAGDGGLLGTEEEEIIKPAIVEAYGQGILAFGPFAADGLFAGGGYARYDGILAMYHDQGLAPFKSLSPDGVNFTAGLSKVRTSPDHGTAFDIAGQDKADAQSMRNAIYAAIDIVGHRRAWTRWSADPLPRAERERNNRDSSAREQTRPERER